MLYINDPKRPHYKYDDVVDLAIKAGVDPKRAYIYLASLGVRGEKGRVMSGLDYGQPVKLAVMGDKLVTNVTICATCKGLVIQ